MDKIFLWAANNWLTYTTNMPNKYFSPALIPCTSSHRTPSYALFAWLISHQPAVLFSQNKPAMSNQPAVLFSQNKSAPAISHQPNEHTVYPDIPSSGQRSWLTTVPPHSVPLRLCPWCIKTYRPSPSRQQFSPPAVLLKCCSRRPSAEP
jgi:hypothetical protein